MENRKVISLYKQPPVNKNQLPGKSLVERYFNLPTDPNDPRVRWHCDTCGWVEAFRMTMNERTCYSRRKCACQIAEEERQERERREQAWFANQSHYIYSWLGERWSTDGIGLKEKSFENFQIKGAWQQEALEVAQAFALQPSGTLVLHGSFGTGKTHLLAAICNELLAKKRITSTFCTSPLLFRAIQAKIQANEDYHYLIERASKSKLFVADDTDKAKWTEFREEIYFEIFDERIKAGLPNAISTNRLNELASFVGGAVCSRLKIGQIDVPMFGADYREEL